MCVIVHNRALMCVFVRFRNFAQKNGETRY